MQFISSLIWGAPESQGFLYSLTRGEAKGVLVGNYPFMPEGAAPLREKVRLAVSGAFQRFLPCEPPSLDERMIRHLPEKRLVEFCEMFALDCSFPLYKRVDFCAESYQCLLLKQLGAVVKLFEGGFFPLGEQKDLETAEVDEAIVYALDRVPSLEELLAEDQLNVGEAVRLFEAGDLAGLEKLLQGRPAYFRLYERMEKARAAITAGKVATLPNQFALVVPMEWLCPSGGDILTLLEKQGWTLTKL